MCAHIPWELAMDRSYGIHGAHFGNHCLQPYQQCWIKIVQVTVPPFLLYRGCFLVQIKLILCFFHKVGMVNDNELNFLHHLAVSRLNTSIYWCACLLMGKVSTDFCDQCFKIYFQIVTNKPGVPSLRVGGGC
jgi:hypothetical protein